MKKLLLVIISVLFMIGCEDKKEAGLRGEVIIDDYSTYMDEVNIDYRIVNTGSEDIWGWIISFTAIMNNGVQYTLNDSVQKFSGYDYYSGTYFYGYAPGDTSWGYTASTPTPYAGVKNVSLKSAIFKAEKG